MPNADNVEDNRAYRSILEAIATQLDAPIVAKEVTATKRKAGGDEKASQKKKARNFTGQYKTADDAVEVAEGAGEVEERTAIDTNIAESVGGQILVKALCKLDKGGGEAGFARICTEKIAADSFREFVGTNRTAFFIVL